ncbi:MAG: carboxypeptidase regulatory-like domain-containing protein [Planctomycetes bacterium]|nr:carboxypeptidase regulatory-like domain-containing protein [Planctomycetota bacterium]
MKRSLLLVLLVALPLGVGAFFVFGRAGRQTARVRNLPSERAEARAAPAEAMVELIPPPLVRQPTGEATTTVLWPVKVELELLEARFLPKEEGVPPIGSGAGARLSGRITGFDDEGVAGEVLFLAGANAGRVLRCDGTGRFGALDLYPGLSLVEVRGASTLGSRRELRLRRGQETLLHIGYGRPGSVTGKVQDSGGKGLEGAIVVVDGTRVLTGAEGGFHIQSVAAGQVLCEVEHEGYALYQELVWVAGGAANSAERMTFTLKPAVELRVAIQGNVGGPGPAQLFVLSDRPQYNANSAFKNEGFPWHRINPIEVWPGTPVTIANLRPEVVRLHVFRAGACAPVKAVNLGANQHDVVIDLQPAPTLTGIVQQDGAPVLGATVRLEAPDRVRATLNYFSEPSYFLETAVMPNLPPGLQETKTDKQGRFVLTAWAEASPVRYLEARGPGGGSWAGRFVKPDDNEIVLELGEVSLGDSTLLVEFPGRHQGLPVELWIGGAPRPQQILAAGEDLEVSNLVAGKWRVTVTWHAQPIKPGEELLIEDVARYEVALPPECIDGQSEEQWKRAGREYPHGS